VRRPLARVAVVALLVAGGGLAAALAPAARRQLEIRRLIRAVGGSESNGARFALEELAHLEPGELALQQEALHDALARFLAASAASGDPGATFDPELVCAVLEPIARTRPGSLEAARRRPALEPCVFRALLVAGRADLACPVAREATAGPQDVISLEWGDVRSARRLRGDAAYLMIGRLITPAPGRPRSLELWITGRERVRAVRPGETVRLRAERARVDLDVELRVLEVSAQAARVSWRIVAVRRFEVAPPDWPPPQ
jgi:hypothetical protein